MFDLNQANYKSLRSVIKEHTNPLVFWVGAGLSIAAGLPNWHQLKKNVCDRFREKFDSLEEGIEVKNKLEQLTNIEAEHDSWGSFSRLYELGFTTYEDAVRHSLAIADNCKIPENYRSLFQIDAIKGIVTMNLDRLVGRAFSAEYSGMKKSVEFCGTQCANYTHVLQGSNPFILNAHGVVDDKSSWILKKDQLNWLLNNHAYCVFIQSILTTYTVVFVGVSVDDIAVKAHLHGLADKKINFGGHYWVTDRRDVETDQFAEKEGILMIRYPDIDGHKALGDMLADLKRYRPRDIEQLDPVNSGSSEPTLSFLPAPDDLIKESDEVIREKLNAHARFILREDNSSRYSDYEQFRRKYDKCIHNCWYVDDTPPHNLLMGYKLVKNIAEGAFGRVFEAKSKDGVRVAVKLLRDEVRRKPEMLQSFRRGVRAMRILSERNVQGMVGYTDCSEIPAFAVMDLIDGPNLKEAVHSGYLDDWDVLLRFATELASIIRKAHQLPERVLHRDIRPANIMLKDYEADPDKSHIVVLDFDLSWHRDALEVSVAQGSAMHGYLAPELTERCLKHSTRNALVDSFGLGMTFYFMRTKDDPLYMQHRHATWSEDVIGKIEAYKSTVWQTLPRRFADLILRCTLDTQSARCDVAQIVGELQRLYMALLYPETVRAADLLCHELAYRSCKNMSQIDQMSWDYDCQQASFALASGAIVTLKSNETLLCVIGSISWDNTGGTDCKNIRKYLNTHVDRAITFLAKGGCKITDGPTFSASGSRFEFVVSCDYLACNMVNVSDCLAHAITEMRID